MGDLCLCRSGSEDDSEDDVQDEEIDNILIVTQTPGAARKYDRTGMHLTRAKMTTEIAEMINDGLYYYELDLQSTKEISYRLKKVKMWDFMEMHVACHFG